MSKNMNCQAEKNPDSSSFSCLTVKKYMQLLPMSQVIFDSEAANLDHRGWREGCPQEIFLCAQSNFQVFELNIQKPHNVNFLESCMLTLFLEGRKEGGGKKKSPLFRYKQWLVKQRGRETRAIKAKWIKKSS